ncbi:Neuropeptide FF receptor 2 [Liparis tanakae]|uniref:Neuropeptide FF receptor 2 n=1 Tax=Liparis tanakae TaxID=230148 RepID=A0A4Z2GTJ2_9TELE|nr:Neuropeptide FF receptor 2 [Liparis tanakae]
MWTEGIRYTPPHPPPQSGDLHTSVAVSSASSMDPSRDRPSAWSSVRPSFSQERLNHTFSFHMVLPSTFSSPTDALHPPLSSLFSGTTRQTSASVHQPPSSSSSSSSSSSVSIPLSTYSASDLADLESMLLWTLHEPSTIALTVMYCLSFILGFAGNLMSLRVLTNRRSRRLAAVSATRTLLVNLAVCDLAVVCVCMPITLGSQIYTAWVYGDLLCRAVPFTQAVSVSASVLTLTVISVNRYYSVRSPLRARSLFTRRRILANVGVVWTVSSIMCAPIVVMNRRRRISFGAFAILVCEEKWPQHRLKQGTQTADGVSEVLSDWLLNQGTKKGAQIGNNSSRYNVLLFVMLYCLPVTFNLTIGFLTGRRLWRGKKTPFADLDPRSEALHASRLKTRQKIAKMVVCLVLLFAASWLPLYVIDLWIDCERRPPSWLLQTRPFAQWLGLTNSSLNPICYCFIGDLYRSARVIRTRYYQKVAALFGSSSFSGSAAVASPASLTADGKLTACERHRVAAAASASGATIPRLLGLTRGQGPGQKVVDSPSGSHHSISDWCRSSPSLCGGSSFPRQPHAAPPPARRHSVDESAGSLPLRIESLEVDVLPLRRHSGGRAYDQTDGGAAGRDALCYSGRRSGQTSQTYFLVEDREEEEEEATDTTSL